jgi:hypothetical protein
MKRIRSPLRSSIYYALFPNRFKQIQHETGNRQIPQAAKDAHFQFIAVIISGDSKETNPFEG